MTAATATLGPGPPDGPGPGADADDTHADITGADFAQWERQLATTGGCHHPIRLHGRIDAIDLATGETAPIYTTGTEPGGVLLTACGNRRETVCPPCSAVYKRDARQLVHAGLTGGKGIPDTIAEHPCVFATLTAPSFGPVHARRANGRTVLPCRPRRDHKTRRCPHGRDISCPRRHADDDPILGRPMCPHCYDYTAAVLFNANAAELSRRFTTYLPRRIAALAGITPAELRRQARVRYVKVAEYQARGVVHFHAVIRLDAPGDTYQPPPARYTADMLSEAIGRAAAAVYHATGDNPDSPHARMLRFGTQTDTRTIHRHTGGPITSHAVANYIAKYATKTLATPGLPTRPIRSVADICGLRCSAHYRQMIATGWELGAAHQLDEPRLRRWAHTLGYGGHYLTKSRRYSVTFGHLRRARTEHRRRQRHPHGETDPWGRQLDDTVVLVFAGWHYAGTGYHTLGDHQLALSAAARAREHDRWAV